MKNEIVGGLYASLALKHGIGKVRQKFPPKVSVTEPEKRRIVELARGATRRKQRPQETRKGGDQGVTKGEAPIARLAATEALKRDGWTLGGPEDLLSQPNGPTVQRYPPSVLRSLEADLAPKGEETIAPAGGDDRGLEEILRYVASDKGAPPALRIRAFSLLVGE